MGIFGHVSGVSYASMARQTRCIIFGFRAFSLLRSTEQGVPRKQQPQQHSIIMEEANVDWRTCPGRAVLLEDLMIGNLSLDEIETTTADAWELYRYRAEFAGVPFSQFKRQLKAHRDQVRKRQRQQPLNHLNVPDGQAFDEEDNRNVDWLRCAAREILLEDLREGRLSLYESETSTDEAWEHYQQLTDFELVPYIQFKRQLKAHRMQVSKLVELSLPQECALTQHRQLFPIRRTDRNGRPLFYLTDVARLLRQDIHKDLQAGLTPSQFRATRQEYIDCGLTMKEFKERIYQEIRYKKYLNHLEAEREKLLGRQAVKTDGSKRKTRSQDHRTDTQRNAKQKH